MGYKEQFSGESMNINSNMTMPNQMMGSQQPMVNYANGPIQNYAPGEPKYIDRTLDDTIDVFKKMLLTGTMVNQAVANVSQTQNRQIYDSYDHIDYKSEDEVIESQYREGKIGGIVIVGFFVAASILKQFITGL